MKTKECGRIRKWPSSLKEIVLNWDCWIDFQYQIRDNSTVSMAMASHDCFGGQLRRVLKSKNGNKKGDNCQQAEEYFFS